MCGTKERRLQVAVLSPGPLPAFQSLVRKHVMQPKEEPGAWGCRYTTTSCTPVAAVLHSCPSEWVWLFCVLVSMHTDMHTYPMECGFMKQGQGSIENS